MAQRARKTTDGFFCQSLVEQARTKKPPFGVGTYRPNATAGRHGETNFNPGPGSYSTRMSSIRNQFVRSSDDEFAQVINQTVDGRKKGFYFTKQNGSLVKHPEPLAVDRTRRQGMTFNKEALNTVGPGHYDIASVDSSFVTSAQTNLKQNRMR